MTETHHDEILASIYRLEGWLEAHDWQAYDPFDGLSSPLAPLLTLGRPRLRIAFQQGVRRFPVNLRPLLGIRPARSSKAMGFLAQGYLALYRSTGEPRMAERARECLRWLEENPSPGYAGLCWGNHFEYEARGGPIPRGVPTVVWSGLIGQAFMDAFDQLGEPRWLEAADSICRHIMKDLPRAAAPEGICIAYTPQEKDGTLPAAIHNSSMIGAALLARVSARTGNDEYLRLAERAVAFTTAHQREDGSWYYGVDPKWHWVDSFHTGYVLEALHTYMRCSGDTSRRDHLERGYRFFLDTFFAEDGTPRYYDRKTYPLDIQCASQGVQTLVNLRGLDGSSLETASRVAHWTIRHMQDPRGYFYFRRYPLAVNRTPTLHWGQSTMFAALALLHAALGREMARAA